MAECLICMFPADLYKDRVLEVGVFVVEEGVRRHDSSLRSVTRSAHKCNTKLSLVELLSNLMCAVSC